MEEGDKLAMTSRPRKEAMLLMKDVEKIIYIFVDELVSE